MNRLQRAQHLGGEVQAGVAGREDERPDRKLNEDERGAERACQRIAALETEGEQEERAVRGLHLTELAVRGSPAAGVGVDPG